MSVFLNSLSRYLTFFNLQQFLISVYIIDILQKLMYYFGISNSLDNFLTELFGSSLKSLTLHNEGLV